MTKANAALDRGALIALGMILATIIIVAGLDLLQDVRIGLPLPQGSELVDRGPAEGYWWPEFSVRDTYAQWAMTLLALAAIIISLIGVLLVRATFVETRRTAEAAIESNETTRQLGKAQVRAYVSWDSAIKQSAHSSETGELLAFVLTPVIKNTGQSPAYLRLLYVDMPTFVASEAVPSVSFDRIGADVEHDLGSGNVFNMPDRHIARELARELFAGQKRCLLVGYGEYRDVFWRSGADTRVFKFCFEVSFQTSPDHLPIEQAFNGLRLHNVPNFAIGPI